MGSRWKRISTATIIALLSFLVVMPAAYAGASWFSPSADNLAPGDQVTMVGFTNGGQLGWIEDGPFYGFVNPDPTVSAGSVPWNSFDRRLIPVGQLTIDEVAPHSVRMHVTFDVPEGLAAGTYAFEYCNDPCTTGIGDLVGGELNVGVTGAPFDVADPNYSDLFLPATLARTGIDTTWLVLLGVALASLGAVIIYRQHALGNASRPG